MQLVKPGAGQEIYDPTVGSGGFLIQSHQYVEEQGENPNDLALYGQDSNGTVRESPAGVSGGPELIVVQNWVEELKRLVPVD